MSVSKYINMCKALDRDRISSYTCWAAIHTDYFIRISSFPSYFLNRACFEKAQLEFCEMHFFGVFSCLPWRIRNTDQGHGPTRTPKTCIHMDHSRNRVTRGGSRKPLCLLHTRVARTFSTQHPVYMDWTKVPTWRWVCQLNPFVANRQNTGKPKPRPSSHAKFWWANLWTLRLKEPLFRLQISSTISVGRLIKSTPHHACTISGRAPKWELLWKRLSGGLVATARSFRPLNQFGTEEPVIGAGCMWHNATIPHSHDPNGCMANTSGPARWQS